MVAVSSPATHSTGPSQRTAERLVCVPAAQESAVKDSRTVRSTLISESLPQPESAVGQRRRRHGHVRVLNPSIAVGPTCPRRTVIDRRRSTLVGDTKTSQSCPTLTW